MSYGRAAFLIERPGLRRRGPNRGDPETNKEGHVPISERIAAASHRPLFHVACALAFVVLNVVGYFAAGGLDFVQGWGGGFAAVIATYFLVFKSQGYWAWMIVNAGLWTALFFHDGLPMLAWLQVSFLGLSVYGAIQWALVRFDIGFRFDRRSDVAGAVIATGVFVYSVVAYARMPGYSWTGWWWVEFGSVVTAIAAIWMDAYRYKLNWGAWTASNGFSAPLFWHTGAVGPFWTIPLYQAINVWGFVRWYREERELRRAEAFVVAHEELENDIGLVAAYRDGSLA